MNKFKVNDGNGTYTIEADEVLVEGNFVGLRLNGKLVAIFYCPVSVIRINK